MPYLVYKTTNIINGKYYIGCHKTKNINDSYLGSGILLQKAIKKYGKHNFKREILFETQSPDEMYAKETELVIIGPVSYNLKKGGCGGFDHCNTPEGIKKRSWTFKPWHKAQLKGFIKKFNSDKNFAKKMKDVAFNASKFSVLAGPSFGFKGKQHSQKSKTQMSLSAQGKHDGSKNSQYGTCWIWHLKLGNRKIPKKQLSKMVQRGFIKGRKFMEGSP